MIYLICKLGGIVYDRKWLLTGLEKGWSIVCEDSEAIQCSPERIDGSKSRSVLTSIISDVFLVCIKEV